ncbi:MAG: hypothetical protein ABSD38_34650 [Syntrophorhabdales bacterium]|jgi:hypothetical protein
MRTSTTRARKFRSTVGKIVMALVVALMIGSISITPAFARDNGRGHGGGHAGHGRGGGGYSYYPAPVYVPPPVVYDPYAYQSPGISLAFPIRIGGRGRR